MHNILTVIFYFIFCAYGLPLAVFIIVTEFYEHLSIIKSFSMYQPRKVKHHIEWVDSDGVTWVLNPTLVIY